VLGGGRQWAVMRERERGVTLLSDDVIDAVSCCFSLFFFFVDRFALKVNAIG